jgi:hypothetical protein
MSVIEIYSHPPRVEERQLLALVIRPDTRPERGAQFATDPSLSLQVATTTYTTGSTAGSPTTCCGAATSSSWSPVDTG